MKEGTQTCTMRYKANSSSWMEILNIKSSGIMYFEFYVKFKAFPFSQLLVSYKSFEALEFRNPTLQTVHKSELKRGNYMHLKQTSQRRMLSSKFTMHFELSPLILNLTSFHL